jgi:hypothetical protein
LTLLKGIVVCLVLANVGYFLWARGIATAESPAQTVGAATLKLASESAVAAHEMSADTGNPGLAAPEPANADAAAGLLTNVKRCISVGPFRDVSEAAHAATTLRGGG